MRHPESDGRHGGETPANQFTVSTPDHRRVDGILMHIDVLMICYSSTLIDLAGVVLSATFPVILRQG